MPGLFSLALFPFSTVGSFFGSKYGTVHEACIFPSKRDRRLFSFKGEIQRKLFQHRLPVKLMAKCFFRMGFIVHEFMGLKFLACAASQKT